MSEPTQRAAVHMPFAQFLADMDCETDDDMVELMDGIADTLGDMLGHQSDWHDAVTHFTGRLVAAAEAAAASQVMAKN